METKPVYRLTVETLDGMASDFRITSFAVDQGLLIASSVPEAGALTEKLHFNLRQVSFFCVKAMGADEKL